MEDKITKDNVIGRTVVDSATRRNMLKYLLNYGGLKMESNDNNKDKKKALELTCMASSREHKVCSLPDPELFQSLKRSVSASESY